MLALILWLLAIACIIFGVVRLIQGALLLGIVLIVVGLLIGPVGSTYLGR